jgi:hypothetical protein
MMPTMLASYFVLTACRVSLPAHGRHYVVPSRQRISNSLWGNYPTTARLGRMGSPMRFSCMLQRA